MHVYAQREIKAGEEVGGQISEYLAGTVICLQVTITYTSLLTSLPRRQDKIASLWFFTCACKRSVTDHQ